MGQLINLTERTTFNGTEKFLVQLDAGTTYKARPLNFFTNGQIKFPATQNASSDANTLDDYEEGTFTPYVEGGTTAGAGTYTLQNGRYLKIGSLVAYSISLVVTAHTGTGILLILGLPFTAATTNPGSVICADMTFSGQIMALPIQSSAIIRLYQVISEAALSNVSIDTAYTLYISGFFRV